MEKTSNCLASVQPSLPTGCELGKGEYAEADETTRHLPDRTAVLADYIDWCEEQLLALPLDERTTVEHALIDGLYHRTMRVPAGVTITGARHLKASLVFLQQGTISVLTERGAALMTAPLIFHSMPGARRLGHAHTDVVWTNIFATQHTDLDSIERECFSLE